MAFTYLYVNGWFKVTRKLLENKGKRIKMNLLAFRRDSGEDRQVMFYISPQGMHCLIKTSIYCVAY